MGLFANPLAHAGYPPKVTGTPETQNSTVRSATSTEIEQARLDNAYISPKNLSTSKLTFVDLTLGGTLSVTGNTVLGSGASSEISIGVASSKIGFYGVPPAVKPTVSTGNPSTDLESALVDYGVWPSGGDYFPLTDNVRTVTCGSVVMEAASSIAGASPITNNGRVGQVRFSDSIASASYGTLVLSCNKATASSIVIASVSCLTANTVLSITEVTPSSGSVSFVVYNSGSVATANNIVISYLITNT